MSTGFYGWIRDGVKRLFRALPFTRWLYRAWTYWRHELRAIGFIVNPRLLKMAEKLGLPQPLVSGPWVFPAFWL